MEIVKFKKEFFDDTTNLLSLFRAHLKTFKNIEEKPDINTAKKELASFSKDNNYPIYVCVDSNRVIGYMVLHIDGVVWIEQIYVLESERRKGVASLLFSKAEEVSNGLGGDTLFNYVHPNNDAMISFLKSKGYTVLNLIEIRKLFKNEKTTATIEIGHNKFDY